MTAAPTHAGDWGGRRAADYPGAVFLIRSRGAVGLETVGRFVTQA